MANNQLGNIQKTTITRTPYFVGFNTVDQTTPPYSLTNIDIVKRDIQNHFATPMGSRVMLPEFGSRIYEYLFDPFDDYTKSVILDDATRIIESDPRVELVDINIYQEDHALNIEMILVFKPESITDSMFVSFTLKDKETY